MKTPSVFLAILFAFPLALTATDNFAEATVLEFLQSEATAGIAGTNAPSTANTSFWYALPFDPSRRVEIAARPCPVTI
jgi:hypothetical protein